MKRVLFLSAWYPNRYDQMAGLFVRKHALAAAMQNEVAVLFCVPSTRVSAVEVRDTTITTSNAQIREVLVYYPKRDVCAAFQEYRALFHGWRYLKQTFMPDIIHANVLCKSTLLADYLRRRYHIPFVLTEHWSGYLPENGAFAAQSCIKKWLMRRVATKAAMLLPISHRLQEAMAEQGIAHPNTRIMHNVVDDFFYQSYPTDTQTDILQLVVINCFDEASKNNKGMLRAYRKALEQNPRLHLTVVGTGPSYTEIIQLADSLCFPDGTLTFTGECTPIQVAAYLYQADCMLMFSRYENAPVVISESLATGTPVVATRVGGIPEMLTDPSTAYLIPSEDEYALTQAILKIASGELSFSPEACRQAAQIYRNEQIANDLHAIYTATTPAICGCGS